MAKSTGGSGKPGASTPTKGPEPHGRLIDIAERSRTSPGTATAKAEGVWENRESLMKSLTSIRDSANEMLGRFTEGVSEGRQQTASKKPAPAKPAAGPAPGAKKPSQGGYGHDSRKAMAEVRQKPAADSRQEQEPEAASRTPAPLDGVTIRPPRSGVTIRPPRPALQFDRRGVGVTITDASVAGSIWTSTDDAP